MLKYFILSAIVLSVVLSGVIIYDKSFKIEESLIIKEVNESVDQYVSWAEFDAQNQSFQVKVPTYPQHAQDMIPLEQNEGGLFLESDMYVSEEVDGTIYMVNLISHPEEIDTTYSENIMENMVSQVLVSNPKNRLLALCLEKGANGNEMNFHIESEGMDIHGNVFMLGKVLYLLSVFDTRENFSKQDFEFFISSFRSVR